MAVTSNTFTGDGSTTNYAFTFEYLEQDEVKVTLDGTASTAFTFANATTLSFTSAPANNVEIRIYRDTDTDTLKATFFPGSAVKAEDLNDNFTQNNFAVQEIKNNTWDRDLETIKSNETWVSNDNQIATTGAMDARFQDEATETIESTETWVSDDDRVPTTQAADERIDEKIDTAITNDILVDSTGLTKTTSSGQVTLGIGAGSVDLDRIKDADIITSSETWSNSDSQVATTQAIDSRIDDAIDNDVLVDGTGLTKTANNGQVTIGIGAGSVDLDRIKDEDIITYAEQDAGSPSPADTNIFTASAAARRFDTLVQTGTPSGSAWETGKTWFANDGDKTLSMWTGSEWTAVTSGGTFNTQPKVVYVDAESGVNTSDGHRISTPKLTIKAAIEQINAEINTTLTDGGSGYTEGEYTGVSLTGGDGTGLTADITVNDSGVVSAISNISNSTLQDYSIGDVLSAADADLGGGGGSGLEITVGGDGDGQVVIVSPGVYQEAAPIQIKRRNVSIVGQSLRSTIIHPTDATKYNSLFEVNSGSFLQSLTFTGMQAGTGTGNTVDDVLPEQQGWNVSFYNNAKILKSPYIQNCTNFSDSEIDNTDLNAHNPRGGQAGDTDSLPTGGGLLVDGSVPHDDSPLRSIVADSYTHVGLNGPGILVTNNGYAQCTSSYAFFNKYHIKALNGGQANLAASTTDFGDQALVADGRSSSAIFTATTSAAATASSSAPYNAEIAIGAPTAASGWHGTATRPQANMLMDVVDDQGTTTYEILSATALGSGWTITVSRPDPSDLSVNLGIEHDIANGADVSFYLRSMIASSGHTMEYVGSGTDYSALPENGGVPDENDEIVELNDGKIWAVTVNDKGRLQAGSTFEVDQQTGFVSIPSGAIKFNDYVEQSSATGEAFIPAGSTGQRTSSPQAGHLRFNTSTVKFEGYDGSSWDDIGGGSSSASGFLETPTQLSSNKIIPANTNAAIVGPMEIADGYTLTINNGSKLVVLN